VENATGREQTKSISREELQSQVLFNSSNLIVGNNLQLRLNEDKRKKELSAANSGNLDPEQVREYLDHFNFLNIRWRTGALSKREPVPGAPSSQDMRVEDLRFLLRFPGYKAGELPAFGVAPAPELEKALASQSSLLERDADRLAMDSSIGGFQADERRVGELRMIQLNFRGVEVHPELTLTFRSKSRTTNAIALGALIVLGIAGVLILKSKRKAV